MELIGLRVKAEKQPSGMWLRSMMARRGLLIAVEGIDGAGKTTQAKRLTRWLNRKGIRAVYTSEPTNGDVGRLIRRYLSGNLEYSAEAVALLFAADRLNHLDTLIKPSLRRGLTIVSDRYLHSSLAYQAASTGKRDWVRRINEQAQPPDIAILIDVDEEEALKRLKGRGSSVFEERSFLSRVRRNYLSFVKAGELVRVDGNRGKDDVARSVISCVERWLKRNVQQ